MHRVIRTALILSLFVSPAIAMPLLLNGNVAQQRVSALTSDIQWYKSLPQAQSEAMRQNKMIFWVHMLGDIRGAT